MSPPADEGLGVLRIILGLLCVITVIVGIWVLQVAYLVIMPLTASLFLAMLVTPIQRWLADRLPRRWKWFGLVASALVILAVLALGVFLLWIAVNAVIASVPKYQPAATAFWQRMRTQAAEHGIPLESSTVTPEHIATLIFNSAESILGSIVSILGALLLIFFLTLTMLAEAHHWRAKSRQALTGYKNLVIEMAEDVAGKVRQYILVRAEVGIVSGVLEGTWLWLMGTDLAFVWGMLFFLLTMFIPNIGTVVAMVPPILLTLIQHGPGRAFVVFGGIFVLEQIFNYVLWPRLQKRSLQVSTVVLLASVLFWGWLWGIVGMLLAVPFTVTIVVICTRIPGLNKVAAFLADTPAGAQKMGADPPK